MDQHRPEPDAGVAAALAACTAITCEMYAERKGWELGAVEVDVDLEYGRSSSIELATVTLRYRRPSTTSSASGCW